MAGRIPQEFIDELVERADIVEVIGTRVQLKKAGREFKAPCPFHNEKTPSFTVSPNKGFYHCFGCGAHGTALGFLIEYERLEFPEAVEELASLMGLDVPRDQQAEQRAPTAPIFEALAKAAKFYQQALKENESAIAYLKSRGLSGETVAQYGIGFAPAGWDFLLKQFPDDEKTRQHLLSAGLITKRDNGGFYDRFRDRVMFPIRDNRGRVVAFGGRVLANDEPKYLNSPETAVFHKGRELYGLYEARRSVRNLEQLVVVEGYMDVVALANNDIGYSVATLGTATTPDHLTRLFRATREITFCFDGDRAGREAAWRALNNSLGELRDGRQISFLFLPDGEDPDSLVSESGREGFESAMTERLSLSDYFFAELAKQADTSSLDGRARFAELARPLIERIPEGIFKELMTDRLAGVIGLDKDRINRHAGQTRNESQRQQRRQRGRLGGRPTLVRQAIELIVNDPSVAAKMDPPAGLDSVDQKGVSLLIELFDIAHSRPEIGPAALIERFRTRPEGPHLQALLVNDNSITNITEKDRQLADCLQRIVDSQAENRLAVLIDKAGLGELSADEKEEMRRLSQSDPTAPDQPGADQPSADTNPR